MTIDYTGGLTEDREYLCATQPDDPEMRESVNAWIWDRGTEFGMPRIGIEAVADQWDTHDIQMNLAFADGRVLNMYGPGKVHDRLGADGKPRVLGAGPLSFELVEPFVHWRLRVDGMAVETSSQAQIDGWMPGVGGGDEVPVELAVDIRSAAPPWESGTLLEEAGRVLATQEEGDLMGGPRFEQLFRATGRLRVGDESWALNGGGLRIRRAGVRRLARFRGHVWQSSILPSGRGFGVCLYPPRDDGKPTFNEGFLFDGDGALIPARATAAPWLDRLEPKGQDVSLTLETEDGRTASIAGETVLSTCHVMGPHSGGGFVGEFALQQAVVQYTWDGETATGMLERVARIVMRFALGLPTTEVDAPGEFLTGAAIAEMARHAEELGFDAVHVTDHPAGDQQWLDTGGHHALDPFVALSFAASATTTLRVQTHIVVLPYRNPFLTAKSVLSLDVLSGGRLIFGVAAGYLRSEFNALGVDYDERNDLFDEALEVMKLALTQDAVAYEGRHFRSRGTTMRPRPVQQPCPPIWIGGNSLRAMRKAVDAADGWCPFPNPAATSPALKTPTLETLDEFATRVEKARGYAAAIGRTAPFDICFAPLSTSTLAGRGDRNALRDELAAYEELGVTQVPVGVHDASTRREWLAKTERLAADLMQ